MLYGYIPLLITLILLIIGMAALFAILPSLSQNRFGKSGHVSFKVNDILSNMVNVNSPPVKDQAYLETYESGEISRGEIGKFVNIQYYIIVLLFVLFDVDMVLLFPWAFDFKTLGLGAFIDTLVFLAMPLFAVFYAFKEGYMEWLR
ncbi:MAG: NADH-quinone oxidoreductase subunit A [Thermoplasmataceae archaeon]